MVPRCPLCKVPLEPVRQSPCSPLNRDQFDAAKAGDWFCQCSSNGRGHMPYAYFWDSEVIPKAKPRPDPKTIREALHIGAMVERDRIRKGIEDSRPSWFGDMGPASIYIIDLMRVIDPPKEDGHVPPG